MAARDTVFVRPPTDKMGRALDALNENIDRTEAWLQEQGLVRRAEVPLDGGAKLAWGKHQGAWLLLYVLPSGTEGPLTSASAANRVEAVGHIHELVREARAAARLQYEEVLRAAHKLVCLTERLPPTGPRVDTGRFLTLIAVLEVPEEVRARSDDDLLLDASKGLLGNGWPTHEDGPCFIAEPAFVTVRRGVSDEAVAAGAVQEEGVRG